jgi:electron transport complex protein RnfD
VFERALVDAPLTGGTVFQAGGAVDGTVSAFLNKTIFSFTGSLLPSGYIDLFNAVNASVIADRALLALLLGSIIITASQVSRAWVAAVYLGVYGLLIRLFGALPFGGNLGKGDILAGFLSGGTIVAAFLLVPEPVTSPKSNRGALFAALFAGIFTYIFRYQGRESYGAFFAVALLNAVVPIIRGVESRTLYARREIAP